MAIRIAGLLVVLAASVATGKFLVKGISQSVVKCLSSLSRRHNTLGVVEQL